MHRLPTDDFYVSVPLCDNSSDFIEICIVSPDYTNQGLL